MDHALVLESRLLSEDVCALLRQIDPMSFRAEREAEARALLDRVAARLRALVEATDRVGEESPFRRIRERLHGLQATLERDAPPPAPTTTPRSAWTAFQRKVQPAYESLASSLRAIDVPAPSLRPTNHSRSVFHVACGLVALSLIHFLPGRAYVVGVAAAFAATAWTLETLRRTRPELNDRLMRLFGPVAHPHERHRVNSSTWYATALVAIAVLFPLDACAVAVMVLGVADPVAALVGRRFGRVRLRAGRSLEGSLAFFVAGSLAAAGTLVAFYPLPTPAALGLAAVAGAAGAVTELFSTRLDDNFTIPVGVAAAAAAALRLLG